MSFGTHPDVPKHPGTWGGGPGRSGGSAARARRVVGEDDELARAAGARGRVACGQAESAVGQSQREGKGGDEKLR